MAMGAYDDYTGAELEQELKDRDLPHSGTNAEKVARLEEDDAAEDAPVAVVEDGQVPPVYEAAGDELADSSRPFSPDNPIKRALVSDEE